MNLNTDALCKFPRGALPLKYLIRDREDLDLPISGIDHDVEISGPIAGADLTPELRNFLKDFREEHADHSYLNSEFHAQLEDELSLDERSHHFIAYRDGEILGVVRATEAPFELSHMTAELKEAAADFGDYFEISRMILSQKGRERWVGLILCFALVEWGITTQKKGLVALCRQVNARRFGFLGFKVVGDREFRISQRENGTYRLMASRWSDFEDRVGMIFGEKIIQALHH